MHAAPLRLRPRPNISQCDSESVTLVCQSVWPWPWWGVEVRAPSPLPTSSRDALFKDQVVSIATTARCCSRVCDGNDANILLMFTN